MQYAPPYYYAGGNQPGPNGQQSQQPQQPQQTQQPQLHMPDQQLYAQHHHGMPAYPMPMPHQHHPGMVHSGADFNMLTKPKRKQVKNACGKVPDILFLYYCLFSSSSFSLSLSLQSIVKRHVRSVMMAALVNAVSSMVCPKHVPTLSARNARRESREVLTSVETKVRDQSGLEGFHLTLHFSSVSLLANGEAASPSTSTYPATTAAVSNVPTSSYPAYANYEAYQQAANSSAPGVPYMQQYVMAMQQQQAMYQNMPYQPSMAAATSSPSLAHPPQATTSLPQSSPVSEPKEQPAATAASGATSSTTTTADALATTSTNSDAATENKSGEEDDGSKLNILSQLCSDVLDRSPKEGHATMTPPSTASVTNDQSSPAGELQNAPALATPAPSSSSSANASPTLYKQDAPQAVYPQQQEQQQWQQ